RKSSTISPPSYFLIINPDFKARIARTIADLKSIQERKRPGKIATRYCADWRIPEPQLFHPFCQQLQIRTEYKVADLRSFCLAKIEELKNGLVLNVDHAITPHDLLNRL